MKRYLWWYTYFRDFRKYIIYILDKDYRVSKKRVKSEITGRHVTLDIVMSLLVATYVNIVLTILKHSALWCIFWAMVIVAFTVIMAYGAETALNQQKSIN